MLEKFGSEEAVIEEMRRRQAKSRENYNGNGGFRSMDADRLKEVSSLAGKASAIKRRKKSHES